MDERNDEKELSREEVASSFIFLCLKVLVFSGGARGALWQREGEEESQGGSGGKPTNLEPETLQPPTPRHRSVHYLCL